MTGFDPKRWQELSPLLDQVLDLPPADRPAWFATLRKQDATLAADLEQLVRDHAALDEAGFLSGSAAPQQDPPSLAGLVVGSYTLRAPLGQGGMGSVWLADRSDGRFEGVAAVKLLNASLIGREGEARFQREGSLLARVRHPNISQLIDAGVSTLGQPYLVIEHVDGERIDHYCDAAKLGIESRIRLFLDVLAAVAFAHTNLIVHRDLKPQNILVTKSGQVKLLDFGIAKLLDTGTAGLQADALTREGASALTPQYAAPEQLTGGPITTATDVYALGVVLYLLLTGHHPSGPTDRSPAEWVKSVVEKVAPKASGAALIDENLASKRGEAPRRLSRILAGDLDNILAKALEKSAGDRYASVESLADDLRRYLNHEPVSARASAIAYRVLKFVRRHRLGVAAAALILVAVSAGTAGVAWQAREAARQRDAARIQLGRATAAQEFTTYLLSVAAPGEGKFTVGELLEQGEALIDKQFVDDDAMRAEMLVTIGQQYFLADRFDKAATVLQRASEIANRTGDPLIKARAACPLALMQVFNDETAAAEAMITHALGELPDEPQFALQRAECLIHYSGFGVVTAEAEPMIERAQRALAILDQAHAATQVKRVEAKLNLAYGLFLAHRIREADRVYEEIVQALEAGGRGRTITAADAYNEWGIAHFHDDMLRAEGLLRHALSLRQVIDAEGAIAPSYTGNLAAVLCRLARFDECEALHLETIRTATAQGVRGLEFTSMMELAEVHLARGDLKRASEQLAKLEPFLNEPKFRSMQREARYAFHRGQLLAAQGQPAAARSSFLQAIELFDKETEKVSNNVDALIGLARAEQVLGNAAAARKAAARAMELSESFIEPASPSYLVGLSLLLRGDLELAAGSRDAARASFKAATEHLSQTLGTNHPATREAGEKSKL